MNRSIFQIWKSQFIILVVICFILKKSDLVQCVSLEVFMEKDKLNERTYFYIGDVEKTVLKNDLNKLLNNFNNVNLELVRYLNQNNQSFFYKDPSNHYNLVLNLQSEYLNYHCSFPFSTNKIITNPQYYELASNYNLLGHENPQFWRPYLSVYDKSCVNIQNITNSKIDLNSYLNKNNLHFKVRNISKFYLQ